MSHDVVRVGSAFPTHEETEWLTRNGFVMKDWQQRLDDEIEAYAGPRSLPLTVVLPEPELVQLALVIAPHEFGDQDHGRRVTRGTRGRRRGKNAHGTRGRM